MSHHYKTADFHSLYIILCPKNLDIMDLFIRAIDSYKYDRQKIMIELPALTSLLVVLTQSADLKASCRQC